MTHTPVEVPDELFQSLRSQFNEAQLVELTATIAWENYRARFNHAFGLAAEGNPILASCMATLGVGLTLIAAKLLAFGFATALHWRSLDFAIALLTLLYVALAICPWALVSAL